jgi:anti-sigma regulatory factor (Ser/Thr protein kinase)
MTVAEMCIDVQQLFTPSLCRVRMWLLPAGSPYHAERRARTILRDVLGRTGVVDDDVLDAEHIVAELAVNAVRHAAPPYELRVVFVGEVWPVWCEVADSSPKPEDVQWRLRRAVETPVGDGMLAELSEHGRGLRMAAGLSDGRCAAYATTVCQTGAAGKAVGFALPRVGAALPSNG